MHEKSQEATHRNNSPSTRINDTDTLVFARRGKETSIAIPGDGKDGVRMDCNGLNTFSRLYIPQHTLYKHTGNSMQLLIIT